MSVAVDQTWRETYLQACIDDEVPPRQEVMQIKPSKQNVDDDGHLGPDSRPLVSGSIQLSGNSDERFTSRVHDREALSLCKVLLGGYNIVSIDLSYNHLTDVAAISLANVLKRSASLQHLNLAQNDIAAAGGKALAEALILNMTLVSFSMRSNPIGDASGSVFGTMLRTNSTLQALDLGGCELETKSLVSIFIALQHQHTLRSLNLDKPLLSAGPQETHSVVQHLSKMLIRNSTVVELSMNHSKLCDDHMAVLCPSLIQNESVISLSFVGNKFTVDAMRLLATVLNRRRDVVELDLSANPLDEEGGITLASAIRSHPSLERLSVLNTRLADRALSALAEAIAASRSLRRVLLWDQNDFTGVNAARLFHQYRDAITRQVEVIDIDWYVVDGSPAICPRY